MAKADDILKKYGITQVKGSESTSSSNASTSNGAKSKGTGVAKADSILSKYGITQVRPSSFGTAQEWVDAGKSLISDVQKSYSSWRKQNNEEQKELQAKISSFISQSESWRSMYAGDKEAVSAIDSLVSALSKASDYAYNNYKYFSQWDTEYDYQRGSAGWLDTEAETNEEMVSRRRAIYDSNSNRIAEIKSKLPRIADTILPTFVENWFLSDREEALKKEMETLEAENLQYERDQGKTDKYYVPVTDEFMRNASFRGYKNASREDMFTYDMSASEGSTALSNGGYYDAEGNIHNAKGDIVQYANAPVVEDKLGLFLSATDDDIAEAYNALSATNGNYSDTWADLIQEGDVNAWRYLTDYEVQLYYDLYKREGQQAAYQYLADMASVLTKRETQETTDYINSTSGLEKIALNVASIPLNVFGGLTSFVDDASNILQGEEINPYSRAHSLQNAASDIRTKTATDITAATGNASLPVVGTTWGDVYQFLMSSADSLLGRSIGGAGYGILMGMGSASAEMKKLYEQGASLEKIAIGGIFSGAAEMVFEKYSIDKLIEMGDAKTIWGVIINTLKQGGIEASEEIATEIANTITNYVVMGNQSDWDGWGTFFKDVANAGIGGFVSGGASSFGVSSVSALQYDNLTRRNGKAIINAGGVDVLRDLANEVAGASFKADSKVKPRNVGRMYNAVATAYDTQNQADIAKSLEQKGYSTKEANAIAGAIVAEANNHSLTEKQEKILKQAKGDSKVQEVISEIVKNKESEMGKRNQVLQDFVNGVNVTNAIRAYAKTQDKAKEKPKDNLTTAEENGSESHYEVSADGKTIDSSGNIVTIQGIASIENGKLMLKTEAGTVDASELSYASQGEALVYEAVSKLEGIIDTETANKLSKHLLKLGDMSSDVYVKGIVQAYTYGYYGYGREALTGKDTLSATLSEKQRNVAYGLGEKYSDAKTDADQAKAESGTVIKKSATTKKSSEVAPDGTKYKKVRFRSEVQKWGKKQQSEVALIDFIASNFSGNTVYVLESYKDSKGRYVYKDLDGKIHAAPNGMYITSTGDIYLDLNAGNHGEGLVMNTFAHELYHHIQKQSPAKAKALAEFLVKEFGYESVEAAVSRQMEKAEKAGHGVEYLMETEGLSRNAAERMAYDRAFGDFVADSLETMFTEGDAVGKLKKLKGQDEGLFYMIKRFVKTWVKKLREFYRTHSTLSIEGDMVAHMEKFDQIQQMFVEALVDAGENYQASITASESVTLTEAGIGFDEDTKSVYSLRYSTAYQDVIQVGKKSFDTEAIAQIVAKGTGRSIDDARKWVKSEMAIANIVMANPEFLDFEADNRYEAIKKNSDYPQGTVDLSNLCPKREEFTAMFDKLQKKYPNKLFTAQDIADMRKILAKNHITVACGACFVEDRRQLIGEIADTFIGMWKEAAETGKPLQKTNAAGKKIELLVTKALAKQYGLGAGSKIMATDTYIPNQYDLTTYEGFKLLEKNHPTIAMAFNRYNNSRGQQSARLIEGRAEYNRQILGWTDAKVRTVNNNGGLRIFSFSDFEVVHLLDLVQVIIDCSARGVKIQGYTKIPAFAKLVRNTGIKLNRSLIPKGDYGFHMENGKVVLDYDNTEGVNIHDVNFIDESDNPNVGNVLIGINPTQISAAFLDPFVDYIIPFHSNKAKAILKKLGTGEWVNYKESQHEKDISTGTASKHNVNIYTQVINKYHPTNKVEFVDAFLKECKRQGKIPRYAEFLNVDENGDYAYREGYHKLLVDFKMFDKDGNILPQGNIAPNMDEGFMKELLESEVDRKKSYQFPQAVYDDIDKQFGEQVLHSDRNFGEQVDEVKNNTHDPLNHVYMGTTPTGIAKVLDLPKLPMLVTPQHIYSMAVSEVQAKREGRFKPRVNYHDLGWDAVKKIPEYINKPVIIIKSNTDPKDSTFMVVTAQSDKTGNPIIAAVKPNGRGNYFNIEFPTNFMLSGYGKNGIQGYVARAKTENRILYANKNSQKTKNTPSVQFADNILSSDYTSNLAEFKKIVKSNFAGTIFENSGLPQFSDRDYQNVVNKAVETFGTTADFAEAGFILPNGKMLKFTDDNHSGERQYDHRAIGIAYGVDVDLSVNHSFNYESNNHLNDFVENGGIRFDPGSMEFGMDAGMQLSKSVPITKEQEMAIRDFVEWKKQREEMYNSDDDPLSLYDGPLTLHIDFGGGSEFAVSSSAKDLDAWGVKHLTYEGGQINASRIIADIRHYYRTGETRQQSSVAKFLYSDRDTESVSNRSLLANAFEGVAQNDIERNKIRDYKNKIDLINAEERKLSELNQKIKDLSFSKGPKDTQAIRDLQFEAKQTSNRINTYDKQLLRLEASKPLQDVLDREKKRAYQRAEKKGKEALEKYREKSAQTQRELLNRWQESRKKGIDSRKRSAVKEKIKAFKARLERSLLNPTDRQYVPIDLIKAMVDVCGLIDMDTELYKADGSINKAQEKRNLTKEKLQNLRDEYEKLKTHSDPIYAGEFDELVYTYLTELRDDYAGKNLNEMSLDELMGMYEILRAIEETLQDARKLIGWGDAENVYEAGDSIVAEQNAITKSRKGGKRNAAQIMRDNSLNNSLAPVRNVERMSGYNQDSALLKLFKKFEQGIRKKNKFVMDAYKSFENLTSGKEYEDAIYNEVGGKKYTDVKGRKFGVSKMQMMQAILSWERESANEKLHHIESGGFTFADVDLLRKGELKKAISAEHSHRIPAATNLVAEFNEILKDDKWCQDYMAEARKFFNGTAKDAINETSIALKHRIIAKDKSYIPFEVDEMFIVREISAANDVQQTINSYGMLKDTKNNAPQALIITGLNNVLDRHIDMVGNVYGLAIEVRNFNKVWNVRSLDSVGNDPTVKEVIETNWGAEGRKHIEQAVQDIQGARIRERSPLYDKIKSGYISATFLLNLSVVTKQIGSLYSATSMLKWRSPVRMVGNLLYTMANHKKISAEVDKYTATAWMRRQGMSDAELHTFMTEGKKSLFGRLAGKLPTAVNPGKWITAMDSAVALSLWRYAKIDTAKRTGLKGEELLKATAEFYDDVVENTQSMTDVLHRPEIQKKGGILAESVAMFKTDLYQMAGQLHVTAGRFNANKTKENGMALGRTLSAVLMSAVWGQLMTTVFALLRYKVNHYRDDEDEELTAESWLKRQGFSFAGDLMGYIFPVFGSEAVGIIETIMYGESEDIVDNIVLDLVNDLYGSMTSIASDLKEGETPKPADMKNLVVKALQCFGVPASNILRTVEAIQLHAKDIANGEFWSFEAGVERSPKHHIHRIMEAMEAGNTNVAIGLYEEAIEETAMDKAANKKKDSYGDDELKEAKSDLLSALSDKYKDGEISSNLVNRVLVNCFDMDKDEAKQTIGKWGFKLKYGYAWTDRGDAYLDGKISARDLKKLLADIDGKTAEEADEYIEGLDFKDRYGFEYSDRKSAYINGEVSESELRTAMSDFGGLTELEVENNMRAYNWMKDNPQYDLTVSEVLAYTKTIDNYGLSIEETGIDPNVFVTYRDEAGKCKGVDADGDGEADRGTKKEEILAVINSLPIDIDQKDALYFLNGWARSTLRKAPWHQP